MDDRHALKDRLGFSKLYYAATGGAALGPDVFKFFMAMGVAMLLVPESPETASSRADSIVFGVFLFVAGAACTFAFGVGVFSPRKPWMWMHGIVLLVFGMVSICLIQFTIPLLVYWVRADVKAYFGAS